MGVGRDGCVLISRVRSVTHKFKWVFFHVESKEVKVNDDDVLLFCCVSLHNNINNNKSLELESQFYPLSSTKIAIAFIFKVL